MVETIKFLDFKQDCAHCGASAFLAEIYEAKLHDKAIELTGIDWGGIG